jgi:SAM-dependent methyltransferase
MTNDTFEKRFLSGSELFGDDFTGSELESWFEDEREGYASLGVDDADGGANAGHGYGYHELNLRHGFRHLPIDRRFRHALGVGSARGLEFEPLAPRLEAVTILEPSDQLVGGPLLGGPLPLYVKPRPDGSMPFDDGTFDLTLCFGTLHHIPNVSRVVQEIARVTEAGGYVLIREPIISMGDWRTTRKPGVTKRERGIPLLVMRRIVEQAGLTVDREAVCVFPLIPRLGNLLGQPAYDSRSLTLIDELASRATRRLYRYHATNRAQKVRPTSAFLVCRKGAEAR